MTPVTSLFLALRANGDDDAGAGSSESKALWSRALDATALLNGILIRRPPPGASVGLSSTSSIIEPDWRDRLDERTDDGPAKVRTSSPASVRANDREDLVAGDLVLLLTAVAGDAVLFRATVVGAPRFTDRVLC
jgi:hypothetical protein